MEDCVFCSIAAGRLPARRVYEDAEHLAFLPLKPMRRGHTLLIPKRHDEYLFALDDGSYHALMAKAKVLEPSIRTVAGALRVGILVEGFSVPHVHIHLIPINALNDIDPSLEHELLDADADHFAEALRHALGQEAAR